MKKANRNTAENTKMQIRGMKTTSMKRLNLNIRKSTAMSPILKADMTKSMIRSLSMKMTTRKMLSMMTKTTMITSMKMTTPENMKRKKTIMTQLL